MSRLAQGPAPKRFARIRFVPFGLLVAATLVFYGCGPNTPDGESGAVTSGSAEWPSTFAIGHDATPAQIEALDIDFRPDQWHDPRAFGVAIRAVLPLVDMSPETRRISAPELV